MRTKKPQPLDRRRRVAREAVTQIQRLADLNYPLHLLIEQGIGEKLQSQRLAGESVPSCMARLLQLPDLDHLAKMLHTALQKGLPFFCEPAPDALLEHFRGLAAVLVATEAEIAKKPKAPAVN